ncbi:unnamed protein product [Pleuronectes platessa]|uniref:Uncharacterized protein n=1 Tax=Pleuronectes platessa TaxID=8262 RepID=A0A9N7USM7_PLEPL|nr:unnamed protein product [Pleuronectes platessa]
MMPSCLHELRRSPCGRAPWRCPEDQAWVAIGASTCQPVPRLGVGRGRAPLRAGRVGTRFAFVAYFRLAYQLTPDLEASAALFPFSLTGTPTAGERAGRQTFTSHYRQRRAQMKATKRWGDLPPTAWAQRP